MSSGCQWCFDFIDICDNGNIPIWYLSQPNHSDFSHLNFEQHTLNQDVKLVKINEDINNISKVIAQVFTVALDYWQRIPLIYHLLKVTATVTAIPTTQTSMGMILTTKVTVPMSSVRIRGTTPQSTQFSFITWSVSDSQGPPAPETLRSSTMILGLRCYQNMPPMV